VPRQLTGPNQLGRRPVRGHCRTYRPVAEHHKDAIGSALDTETSVQLTGRRGTGEAVEPIPDPRRRGIALGLMNASLGCPYLGDRGSAKCWA
jgi:hypothetical protein